KELKSHLTIPVIGNGDVITHQDMMDKFTQFDVDGVMVARGCLGNPWIFSGLKPTIQEVYETMLEHLEDHLSFYGNHDRAYRTFRKHIVWYTSGLRDSSAVRDQAFKERDNQKMMEKIHTYFQTLWDAKPE